jgi:hypothetical protein
MLAKLLTLDRQATRQLFEKRSISMSLWCKNNNLKYQAVNYMLKRSLQYPKRQYFADGQLEMVAALVRDGLYVCIPEEGASVSEAADVAGVRDEA